MILRNIKGSALTHAEVDGNFIAALQTNPARARKLTEFMLAVAKCYASPIVRKETPLGATKPTKLGQTVVVPSVGAFLSYGYQNTEWSTL